MRDGLSAHEHFFRYLTGFPGDRQGSTLAGSWPFAYGFVFLVVWEKDRFCTGNSCTFAFIPYLYLVAFGRIWARSGRNLKIISAEMPSFRINHPRKTDAFDVALSIARG